ncbi:MULTISPECIES: helicase associated domain-containing protein [unclassified Streptomyces]|uniref:helicase associated domain-containing protein n=1 Tax=unclassified Streptomyces TaxID=2593676 RepID=UPI000A5822AF|nr:MULTISPECIES: helicase associated domain-containing protein [unclassified Streptomyces]
MGCRAAAGVGQGVPRAAVAPGQHARPGARRPRSPVREAHRRWQWALNLRAARQFHAREGHLRPDRKHIERVDINGEAVDIKLGTFLDNTRRRADKLTPQRRAELDQLGMRWK